MITINGEPMEIEEQSIADFLISAGYDAARVAVEINLNIIPKAQYEETNLHDGDTVEVVTFVGGG
ncbi:MAG: sulfur carrier protein ThiS [Lachnospiraceae bacterium]